MQSMFYAFFSKVIWYMQNTNKQTFLTQKNFVKGQDVLRITKIRVWNSTKEYIQMNHKNDFFLN